MPEGTADFSLLLASNAIEFGHTDSTMVLLFACGNRHAMLEVIADGAVEFLQGGLVAGLERLLLWVPRARIHDARVPRDCLFVGCIA